MASLDEFAREQFVLTELRTKGQVSVNELAGQFQVSTVTIRKDLDLLERRKMLRRVRGGAVSIASTDEGTFEMRLWHAPESKRAIAKAVAPLVHDGDVIAMDSSTTVFYLAQEILDRRNLVVVTNGLRLAVLFMEQSSARVLMPGGVLRRSAGSMVGPIGDVLAGRGRIAKGFFGVAGLSTQHGLMDLSAEEAQTKLFLANACDEVYGLFDSSKVGGFGLHSFADTPDITGLYTDEGVAPEMIAEWRDIAVPLEAVSLREPPPTAVDPRSSPAAARRRFRTAPQHPERGPTTAWGK